MAAQVTSLLLSLIQHFRKKKSSEIHLDILKFRLSSEDNSRSQYETHFKRVKANISLPQYMVMDWLPIQCIQELLGVHFH